MTLPTSKRDESNLDFVALVAALHRFIGRLIVVESVGRDGFDFHRSSGQIHRVFDAQVELPIPVERPALITFQLDSASTFTIRENEVEQAVSYAVYDDERDEIHSNVVRITIAEAGDLIVRDAWESSCDPANESSVG